MRIIGAIQLALNVAARSDKANMALSWIVDGRPDEVGFTRLSCFYNLASSNLLF